MKVITIKEPFATLILEGYKEYEFRTWKTNYRGDVLIHAGKTVNKEALNKVKDLDLNYSKGEIIAKAKITDCILVDEKFRKELIKKNKNIYYNLLKDNGKKLYAFKIENVEKIKTIKVNGKLSLWEYKYID